MTGYGLALAEDMDIIVKTDGDGQMAPKLVSELIRVIGLESFLPGKLKNALFEGHPGVKIYRLPPRAAAS